MILRLVLPLIAVLLMTSGTTAADSSGSWWQLVFHYDQSGLHLIQAMPFASPGKTPSTPGLQGAPVQLTYQTSWQNAAGVELANSMIALPLGIRSAPSDGGPCIMQVPSTGIVVVRAMGPAASSGCTALQLTAASPAAKKRPDLAIPPAFEFRTQTLPLTVRSLRPAEGPLSVVKLRDTGPDQNRFVMVVLGDGYTSSDLALGTFTTHTNTMLSVINSYGPWDVMFDGSNIYRIDVESNQSGADMDPYGTYKDTYFNSSFWTENIERLLAIDYTGYLRAIAAADTWVGAGVWDQLIIQVNSTKYGGSGGDITVLSAHGLGPQILVHELGHSFANLADEYSDPYPGYPPGDGEPNVDYDGSGPGLKWLAWVLPTTPLPTPATTPYLSVIGAFQGARYRTTGIYRPVYTCMMRALVSPFDSVCQEAQLASYFNIVNMIDATSPTAPASVVPPSGRSFAVTPVPLNDFTYQWQLDDSIISDSTGPTFSLSLQQLTDHGLQPVNTLTLHMTYQTTRMRLSHPSSDRSWVLQPDCNSNSIDDSIDIATGLSFDINGNGLPDECEVISCCTGTTGNVNMVGIVDLADLSMLIAYLINTPRPPLPCADEANINTTGIIDLSDLSLLIAYLTTLPASPLPLCP